MKRSINKETFLNNPNSFSFVSNIFNLSNNIEEREVNELPSSKVFETDEHTCNVSLTR